MMVARKDYYKILGVGQAADRATLKRAYRRLALKYHPDRATTRRGAARFLEIQEAYAALSDPVRRRQYDRARPGRVAPVRKARAGARAPRSAAAPSRRLFHLVVEGLGLSIGVSLGDAVGRRRR